MSWLLPDVFRENAEYKSILSLEKECASRHVRRPSSVVGLCEDAQKIFVSAFLSDVSKEKKEPVLVLFPDEKKAASFASVLSGFGLNAVVYPVRDFNFYTATASLDFEHERLFALHAILKEKVDAVLSFPDAALQYTMPREVLSDCIFTVRKGKKSTRDSLALFLSNTGYARVDLVDGVGQFSVRGDILDVFPPCEKEPVRIEFFDTDVERICLFDPLSQRKLSEIEEIDLIPAREVLVTPEGREIIKKQLSALLKKEEDDEVRERLLGEIEIVSGEGEIPFSDRFISLLYPQKECLLDYFSEDAIFLQIDYSAVKERLSASQTISDQTLRLLIEQKRIAGKNADFSARSSRLEAFSETRFGLFLSAFSISFGGTRLSGTFSFQTRQLPSLFDNFSLLSEELTGYLRSGFRVLLSCESKRIASSLSETLRRNDIPSVLPEGDFRPSPGLPVVCSEAGSFSFELPSDRFACISMYSTVSSGQTGSIRKTARRPKKKDPRERILSYNDISPGDFVVHDTHGIGQYIGMQTLPVEGSVRDFLKIRYAGSDLLYLPCDKLDVLAKYIGPESGGEGPRLSKMGGAEWTRAKQKVKEAAKDMAKDLIQLYATRLRRPGHAFPEDDDIQREFESSFPYEETEGQLEAAREIKRDMQRACPMDRLLCGDVGFGKTEVALRAAFKAVLGGRQVAFLCPTTILALQHYRTLLSRMRGFPVRVDMLSRFVTEKEQREIVRRLKRGETDVVVGTHRLLSRDIEFKQLGLVIVDEEQRFGVAHKEHLKKLSENVDVLTLTATPIPRTLNMAMTGIRDMSVLEEPPFDRQPVQTYVIEYDEEMIAEAIRKELRRGGQVFYMHNDIETMEQCVSRVASMVPEARIAEANGRMDGEVLSDIWRDMLEGKIDVFVCTTIIETGVDVPNANTLIIENADRLGLSQLHQIRGRIGRSSRRAYAYFTFPKGKVVSEVAEKRLSAIRDYAEFGAGFKIALRDMEIRGAGNLFGEEQHGHMARVGYDMYMKLLNEAILEEKGTPEKAQKVCAVSANVDAYIPQTYIQTGSARIETYKRISLIASVEDRKDVAEEIADRFGKPPAVVDNLLDIALLRSLGSLCGLDAIEEKKGVVLFRPGEMEAIVWLSLAAKKEYKGRLLLNFSSNPFISFRVSDRVRPFSESIKILTDYIQIKEGDL